MKRLLNSLRDLAVSAWAWIRSAAPALKDHADVLLDVLSQVPPLFRVWSLAARLKLTKLVAWCWQQTRGALSLVWQRALRPCAMAIGRLCRRLVSWLVGASSHRFSEIWLSCRRLSSRVGTGVAGILWFTARTLILLLAYSLPVLLGLAGIFATIGSMDPSTGSGFLLLLCVVLPLIVLRLIHRTRNRWAQWGKRLRKTKPRPFAEPATTPAVNVEDRKDQAVRSLIEDLRR